MSASASSQSLNSSMESHLHKMHIQDLSSEDIGNVFCQVLGTLSLKDDDIKEANKFLNIFIKEQMVEGLKKLSPLFKKLYRYITWMGSFYEGLKISKPDEFDLNFVLKMPAVMETQIEIVSRSDLPGFVTVNNFGDALQELETNPHWKPVLNELSKWKDEHSGNLLQNKVHQWFEGIVAKFVEHYNLTHSSHQIKTKKSGPAMTIEVEDNRGQNLSIDLVPVFAFTTPLPPPFWTPKAIKRRYQNAKRARSGRSRASRKNRNPGWKPPPKAWFIVPKPLKNGVADAWRVNMYQFEKLLLLNYGTVKPAIKLIKKLRDIENWEDAVYSYAIKTMALWMIEEGELSIDDPIEAAFFNLLEQLEHHLKQGHLSFYWDERDNLLRNLTRVQCKNYSDRLGKLIVKFKRWNTGPADILNYFEAE